MQYSFTVADIKAVIVEDFAPRQEGQRLSDVSAFVVIILARQGRIGRPSEKNRKALLGRVKAALAELVADGYLVRKGGWWRKAEGLPRARDLQSDCNNA